MTPSSLPNGRPAWQSLSAPDVSSSGYIHQDYVPVHLIRTARRVPRLVLDVGCFAGATGAFIKTHYPGVRVVGIEPREDAARRAAERLDAVQAATFEAFDFAAAGITPGSVDTVILADVLEHMYDPWSTLLALKPWLDPHAQLLVSIPNTRNLWLMEQLAGGEWRYESQGLLDITHIRFFTRRSILEMFNQTGYRVDQIHCHIDDRCRQLLDMPMDAPTLDIAAGRLTLKGMTRDDLAELATLQFYFVAEPAAGTP